MAVSYNKDGAYIEVTDNGVTYRRLIKWEDCVVSVPANGTEKVDMVYINGSDQLVLVLEDESEITIASVGTGLYLPLTGGTMTGNIDLATATTETVLTLGIQIENTLGNALFWFPSGSDLFFKTGDTGATGDRLKLDKDGNLTLYGTLALGGTVIINGQAFDAGSGSARIHTTGADSGLVVQSTQDGSTGAILSLRTLSASPLAGDVISQIVADGRNSTPATIQYGRAVFELKTVTAGSEDAIFKIFLRNSGSNSLALTLNNDGSLVLAAGLTVGGDILLAGNKLLNANLLQLDEITTPSALVNHAQLYTKSTNKFFFQDGAGVEHEMSKASELTTHGNLTTAHSAVSAATASRIVVRDASARAKFAAPGAAGDALIKGTALTITEMPANVPISSLTFIIDGGGSAITTGIKGDLEIPFACTINQVTMLADQSGSIVVDIWKQAYADYPPEDANSITASAVPTITTDTDSQDSTLSGWTTAIAAGDTLRFNVDSVTDIERLTISLKVTKT